MNTKRIIELKKWMLENGIKQVDIAKKANVGPAAVWMVMHKNMVSANIKNAFLSLGCPPELLERDVA